MMGLGAHQFTVSVAKIQTGPLQLPYLSARSNVSSQQERGQTQRHVTGK